MFYCFILCYSFFSYIKQEICSNLVLFLQNAHLWATSELTDYRLSVHTDTNPAPIMYHGEK